MRVMSSVPRFLALLTLAAALFLGASTPTFAAGLSAHATHIGNCGKYTSQTHKTSHGAWTMKCPSKPHHHADPAHPLHPTTPTTNASGTGTAPGLHVRTTTPGWAKNHLHLK